MARLSQNRAQCVATTAEKRRREGRSRTEGKRLFRSAGGKSRHQTNSSNIHLQSETNPSIAPKGSTNTTKSGHGLQYRCLVMPDISGAFSTPSGLPRSLRSLGRLPVPCARVNGVSIPFWGRTQVKKRSAHTGPGMHMHQFSAVRIPMHSHRSYNLIIQSYRHYSLIANVLV